MSVYQSVAALRCAPNFRDVAETVPALKPGVLFRSDAIIDPDGPDGDLLSACGIRLVVDLRSKGEPERELLLSTI